MDIENFYATKNGKAPRLAAPEIVFRNDGSKTVHHHLVNVESLKVGTMEIKQNKVYASDIVFVEFETNEEALGFEIPNGSYDAVITLADVSDDQDGFHKRTAYLSLVRNQNIPSSVRPAKSLNQGEEVDEDTCWYFSVDAGTGCFYTEPPEGMDVDEYLKIFDIACDYVNGQEYCLIDFNGQENSDPKIFGSSSGWGDGSYPVFLTFDEEDEIIGIHIDYEILGKFTNEEIDGYISDKEKEDEKESQLSNKPLGLKVILEYIFRKR